jgi:hypothetical protein
MFKPVGWNIESERRSAIIALVVTLVFFVPSAAIMLYNLLYHNFGLFGG